MTDLFAIPAALLERFTAHGIDPVRVLGEAKLSIARFREPKARLTTAEFLALWRALEAVAPADFGVKLITETPVHHHDVATFAALHSSNLGEALAKKARFKRLTCPQEILVELAAGEARVRSVWSLAEGALPRILIDTTFANLVQLARRGTGSSISPRRLELARPASRSPLVQFAGCEARFDAPVDAVIFDETTLAIPFVTHNADLVAMLAPGLEAALEETARGRTVVDDVRRVLRQAMSGERPSVDKVAASLHLSARTLQRKLGELGTSYQQILDDVRHQAARQLLSTTELDTSEVAFLLGFEELNSFTRAFVHWEGINPNRWRERS